MPSLRRLAWRPLSRLIPLAVLLAATPPAPGRELMGDGTLAEEYEVKAVFIYNFTLYMSWPAGREEEPFEIAVFGDSAILEPLREIAARRKVGERSIAVRRVDDLRELGTPEILFLPAPSPLGPAVLATRARPILTVAEGEGALAHGVAVVFVLREGFVRFYIDQQVLCASGIAASSHLLKLALPVGGGR